jgi:hypothetical protein
MKKLLLCIATAVAVLPVYPLTGFREMQNNIGISAVACKHDELLVDAGGWKFKTSDFIKKGFKPVRVQIVNHSDQVVSISDSSVHFASTDMHAITDQFKCRENLRPLAYFVITQSVFGSMTFGGLALSWLMFARNSRRVPPVAPIFLLVGLVSGACWAISTIRTPFYWMNLREANRKLHDIVTNALHAGHIIIPPHHNAEKIVLVPVNFHHIFSFEVMNEGDGTTAAKFYVDVRN